MLLTCPGTELGRHPHYHEKADTLSGFSPNWGMHAAQIRRRVEAIRVAASAEVASRGEFCKLLLCRAGLNKRRIRVGCGFGTPVFTTAGRSSGFGAMVAWNPLGSRLQPSQTPSMRFQEGFWLLTTNLASGLRKLTLMSLAGKLCRLGAELKSCRWPNPVLMLTGTGIHGA